MVEIPPGEDRAQDRGVSASPTALAPASQVEPLSSQSLQRGLPDRECIARALHGAFGPFADYSYNWGDPLASKGMFYVLADAVLTASVGRNAKRHDREDGHGPKDEHAVGEAETPTPPHQGGSSHVP